MLLISALDTFRLVEITGKNRTDNEIRISLTPKYKDEGIAYSNLIVPANDEVIFTIVPAVYWLSARGYTESADNSWACFGDADKQLWDKNRAKREVDLSHKANITITVIL